MDLADYLAAPYTIGLVGDADASCRSCMMQIKYVKGLDLSPKEVQEARRRYEELLEKPEGTRASNLVPGRILRQCTDPVAIDLEAQTAVCASSSCLGPSMLEAVCCGMVTQLVSLQETR